MDDSDNFNALADKAIAEQRWSDARGILQNALACMPADWKPIQDEGDSIVIAFWDREEFFSYVHHQGRPGEKSILWTGPSYSKAWWQLAYVEAKEGQLANTLFCVETGLQIEPDQPDLWMKKGYTLSQLQRYEEALKCYETAATIRDWAPQSQIALAFRGQGSALIDLDRLDDAERAFQQSLELDPDSAVAGNELEYIRKMRESNARKRQRLPWPLQALLHPPEDPLTVQLLALVEDLPSIPGPQVVGSDNYSKIANAFFEEGWPGFERVFDEIVPRTRPDYAAMKRELLRESIFSSKAIRNAARLLTGKETVEEMFERMQRVKQAPKPLT